MTVTFLRFVFLWPYLRNECLLVTLNFLVKDFESYC